MKQVCAVCLMVVGCLFLTPGAVVAEDPGTDTTSIWVPVPVIPNHGGGYTIQPPGKLPTHVQPVRGGGYTVQTPGELPTHITPTYGGGYTIQTPGELPTYVRPE